MSATIDTKWNAHLYDDKHAFVFKYGEELVSLLAPALGEEILDLGCGTGHLTHLIAEAGADVTGVDSSAAMIEAARKTYPGLSFQVASATDLPFEQAFDAVFSNAVLHWVLDKDGAIDNMYRSLRGGGRLVLEMGGEGNVEQIIQAIRTALIRHGYHSNAGVRLWYFPSLGEYAGLLEKRGFRVGYASHFDRETRLTDNEHGVTDWIRMFGADFFRQIPEEELNTLLEEIQETLRPTHYRYQSWWADYKRLRIAATKR